MQALLPAARLHLARGDHELVSTTVGRGLRVVGDDRLRAVELLTLLVDAHLAAGDVEAADAACEEAGNRAAEVAVPSLHARSAAARARVLAAAGDARGAAEVLTGAIDRLDAAQLPWLRAMLTVELAGVHELAGDLAAARRVAASAGSALAALDVVLLPVHAAVLDRLGQRGEDRSATRTAGLARDGKWWVASCDGSSVRLRDTKGLRYLAELVATPGVERHALDLVDRIEGVGGDSAPDRRALGDAGELLDARSRAAYRRRIEELRMRADDALASGQLEVAEAHQEELDQLVQQLAQAFGLGGRSRTAASAAERARLNVTRSLRKALSQLNEALPGAGAVLDRRVRTGMYCAYEPADDEVRWIVHT